MLLLFHHCRVKSHLKFQFPALVALNQAHADLRERCCYRETQNGLCKNRVPSCLNCIWRVKCGAYCLLAAFFFISPQVSFLVGVAVREEWWIGKVQQNNYLRHPVNDSTEQIENIGQKFCWVHHYHHHCTTHTLRHHHDQMQTSYFKSSEKSTTLYIISNGYQTHFIDMSDKKCHDTYISTKNASFRHFY